MMLPENKSALFPLSFNKRQQQPLSFYSVEDLHQRGAPISALVSPFATRLVNSLL